MQLDQGPLGGLILSSNELSKKLEELKEEELNQENYQK